MRTSKGRKSSFLETEQAAPPRQDWLTLVAIGVVAFLLQNVLHEGVGHGGACLLMGGRPVALSTAYFDCDLTGLPDWSGKVVASAGSLLNAAVGLLLWVAVRRSQRSSPIWRTFLWLSMSVNLLAATGYFLFSGILGVGDWMVVIDGLQPAWLWRLALVVLGLALYGLCTWISLRVLNDFIGSDAPDRFRRAGKLTIIPYLAGSSTTAISSLFNPLGAVFFVTSAAASFGGASALAWMGQLFKTNWMEPSREPPLEIPRNWWWIGGAVLLHFLRVGILGRGVEF
jgi:hypothetical protein